MTDEISSLGTADSAESGAGATRILVAGMPAAGHVNPSLPVVRELIARGIAVTYLSDPRFRTQIEDAGCEFRPYPANTFGPVDIADATQHGGPVRVVSRIRTATETLLPFTVAQAAVLRPRAIAFDSNALWGRMAAAKLDLPMISLMTTVLIGFKAMPALQAREWFQFIREMIPEIPAALSAKNGLMRKAGKNLYPSSPEFPMRGDVSIFPVPRWMQKPDSRIDENCHYVGATINTAGSGADLDPELAAFVDSDEPLVVVSLGTLHAGTDAFFRSCFEALGKLPVRVLIAAGSGTDPARLRPVPANTMVRSAVPQLDVLRRAAVFVTHGGMNSALEGIAFGVPLVVVPQQFEQLLIGQLIADRGAAVVLRHNLSHRPVPTEALRAAVQRALTDSTMQTTAHHLSTTLGDGGGAPAAANAIQNLLTRTATTG